MIAIPARAADKDHPQDLADLSIEELLNIPITSVSKKEQKLGDAAAAISVLSNDELRRSGFTSIAEALRLVPGMDVASINSSQRAISARGFNSLNANKLLVLVDGRAVYSPIFAGVNWNLQQTMLEDVDRIEVIRGPGSTVWGANAVNGVINVVGRSARETQGGFIYGGGGDVHQAMGGARYGGALSDKTYYRVFGGYQLNDRYPLADGQPAGDLWQGGNAGVRVDHYPDASAHLTWQADATVSDLDSHDSSAYNVNTLARWSKTFSERSSLEIQAYYDRLYRNEISRARVTTDTADLTAQHTFALGARHDVIWGLGYRVNLNAFAETTNVIHVQQQESHRQLFNAFIQDEFHIIPEKLSLTAGTKIEHTDFTGFEIEPSIRAMFKPTVHQTLWSAVSRATRTPSELERNNVFAIAYGAPFTTPGGTFIPTLVGNPRLHSEVLWAYELGYRIQPAKRLNIDLATFFNHYERVIAIGPQGQLIPGTPVGIAEVPWINGLQGETYGGEVSITVAATDTLRFTAGYSLLIADLRGPPESNPTGAESTAPRHQAILRSSYDFSHRGSIDAQLRYEDSIKGVPSYVTADLRLSYRPTDNLEISLVGQNLLDNSHPERPSAPFTMTSEVPRGFYGKLTLRF